MSLYSTQVKGEAERECFELVNSVKHVDLVTVVCQTIICTCCAVLWRNRMNNSRDVTDTIFYYPGKKCTVTDN